MKSTKQPGVLRGTPHHGLLIIAFPHIGGAAKKSPVPAAAKQSKVGSLAKRGKPAIGKRSIKAAKGYV